MAKKTKKIVRKCQWIIEVDFHDDGTSQMRRENNGFNAFELLGIVEETRNSLKRLINPNEQLTYVHPAGGKIVIKKKK